MKIIVTLIPIDLVTNWLLSLFVFSYEAKTEVNFSESWWSGNKKYFCFLFIASRPLLQRHADFYKGIFLHAILVRL